MKQIADAPKKRRPLGKRFRSWLISFSAAATNWVNDHIYTNSVDINWKDHLRWWLERRFDWIFTKAYDGSDEELRDVYQSVMPVKYFNPRQLALLVKPRAEYGAHCIHCSWSGWLDECEDDNCPVCLYDAWLDDGQFEEVQS